MTWTLKCGLCGHTTANLVAIQEHAMNEHGYTIDDLRRNTKRETDSGGYIYTFPDGTDWLIAERTGGNYAGDL